MPAFAPLRSANPGGQSVIRLDTLLISTAIISVVGVFVVGLLSRPGTEGAVRASAVAVEHFDARGPAVTVIDGDTLDIDGEAIRLAGIDTPELGQPCDQDGHLTACGREAAFMLRKIIEMEHERPACTKAADGDAFTCQVGSVDPAEVLLESGLAVALSNAPMHYRLAERRAREVPLGIWKGAFVVPADWRAGKRLPAERDALLAAKAATDWPRRVAGLTILPEPISHRDPCVIKGVIAGPARWYFGPLDPGYAQIDVKPGSGRMFCSDDEARNAGWRHGHLAMSQRPSLID